MWERMTEVIVDDTVYWEDLDIVDSVHSTLELTLKLSSSATIVHHVIRLSDQIGVGGCLFFRWVRPTWLRSCLSRAASWSLGCVLHVMTIQSRCQFS